MQFEEKRVTPQNIFSPIKTSWFLHPKFTELTFLSIQLFRPMFIQEKVILTFQRVNVTFLTKRCGAYKLYMLLHTKCLLTSKLIVWWAGSDVLSVLHSNMMACCLYTDFLLCFIYVFGNWRRFLVDLKRMILKLWEIGSRLSVSRRTSGVQERIIDFKEEWDG